ncbi:MAG: hypothetical protein JO292_09030 [Betaproteobacteria bacterium]|nr:hypothetical protein [Betaproteobacteria bacterium]MBV9361524.1 hypothetical protein [Betaproteobacteria bacterium]
MKLAAVVLMLAPVAAPAQQQDPVQRAVIERDRQSAEFARPELRDYHLRKDQQHLPQRPDERQAEERDRNAQPVAGEKPSKAPDYSPLPLPGGPAHGVNVIPVQGRGS